MRFRAFAAASGLVLTQSVAGCLVYGEDLLGTGGGGGSGTTTTGTGTDTTTTTTSTGQPCNSAEDCPETGSVCKHRICPAGTCEVEILPANTELSDPEPGNCLGLICDSAGGSIEVEDSKDIPDDMNSCTADSCEVGKPKHTPKLGFACGSMNQDVCNDEGDCVECVTNNHCPSGILCEDYKCSPASCNDGTKNGSETDEDCGGSCADCATGKACKVNTDCKSGSCTGMICQPSCTDTLKNNAETDVDCGGPTCDPCGTNKTCGSGTDCESLVCTSTKCAAPTCSDGQKNGTETAVDCGGASCPSCALDHMVINEVDYDQPSTDNAEFVEIFNATSAAINLTGYKLVLVDGVSNGVYGVVDLAPAGTLAAGQYLVVGPAGLSIAPNALKIDFPGAQNQLQNGLSGGTGSPDGLALINDTTDTLVDVVSYEGAITTANLSAQGLGTVSLVEGVALAASVKDEAGGSLCRLPSGKDSGSSAADWAIAAAPTPGALNVP